MDSLNARSRQFVLLSFSLLFFLVVVADGFNNSSNQLVYLNTQDKSLLDSSFGNNIIKLVYNPSNLPNESVFNVSTEYNVSNEPPLILSEVSNESNDSVSDISVEYNISQELPIPLELFNNSVSNKSEVVLGEDTKEVDNYGEKILSESGISMDHLVLKKITISKEELPYYILNNSQNFLKNFLSNEDFDKNFRLRKFGVFYDSITSKYEYHLIYDYQIKSLRENGKETLSVYPIKIVFSENGELKNSLNAKEKYDYLKKRDG